MMTLTQRELVSEISQLLLCVGQVPVVVTEPAGTGYQSSCMPGVPLVFGPQLRFGE